MYACRQFLCMIAECIAHLSHRLGVCLDVRLTHLWSVSERCKLGSRSLHCGLPQGFQFLVTKFCAPGWGGSPQTRASKIPPLKDVILPLLTLIVWKWLQIGMDMLFIITSTGDRLFRLINIDDIERPWTPKKGVLVNFLQFLDAAHISILNCDERAGNRPRQHTYEIFSIKRRFWQSKSWPPRFKEAGAGRRQRQLPPP